MPTRRDFLLASSAFLATGFSNTNAKTRKPPALDSIQQELRTAIPALMRQHKVPGASLALVRDREIVWTEAFGLSDVEAKVKLTPQTVFEAASLSKPAFAYVVLKFAEQGKLDLRRPVVDYLGHDPAPQEPRFKQVTLLHLLSHTSGIDNETMEGPPKLNFSPGERFEYSPHAFDFLQLAVEQAIGEKLAPMMDRMLLRPLKMSSSSFDWTEEFVRSAARGYNRDGKRDQTIDEQVWRLSEKERAQFLARFVANPFPNAAAGLHSTPFEYARFLIAAMHPSTGAVYLGKQMHAAMLKPQVNVRPFNDLFWGLGFGLQRPKSGPNSFWHWGAWRIFQHYAVAYPDEGSAFVLMTNSAVGLRVAQAIAPRALGHPQPAFAWLMR